MKIYIYALQNPVTKEIRYIGKTGNINNRYNSHLNSSKKLKSHLGAWIKSLLIENILPEIVIIEECNEQNWEEREIYWISQYPNLVNIQKGGNQPPTTPIAYKKYTLTSNGKYKVRCSHNNTVYYLGCFDSEKEAIQAYDLFYTNPEQQISQISLKYNSSPILMYKDNILIKEFTNASQIMREMNIPVSNIIANCKGKYKTCRGYVFKYKTP